jgi:hypothetical protein
MLEGDGRKRAQEMLDHFGPSPIFFLASEEYISFTSPSSSALTTIVFLRTRACLFMEKDGGEGEGEGEEIQAKKH